MSNISASPVQGGAGVNVQDALLNLDAKAQDCFFKIRNSLLTPYPLNEAMEDKRELLRQIDAIERLLAPKRLLHLTVDSPVTNLAATTEKVKALTAEANNESSRMAKNLNIAAEAIRVGTAADSVAAIPPSVPMQSPLPSPVPATPSQ